MKMRSRLTALVLAVLMLISTAAPALATTALTLSDYQGMVDSAADQATSQPVIDEGGQVYDLGDTAQHVASGYDTTVEVTLAAGEGEQDVALPVNGKVLLTADIAAGQWQVQVGDQWVNMHGETDSTIEVTFAKVQSLFVMNNAAKLRFISADGSAVSNVANVGLDYSVQTLEEDVAMPMMYNARALNANAGIALAAEGEEEMPTTLTVEIAYQFADGEPAATSYAATIGYNTDLTTSVIQLPKVAGYLPTCAHSQSEGVLFVTPDPDTDFNGTIQLSLKKVTENKQFIVTYVPTYVDFVVRHHLMGFDAKQETAVHQTNDDQTIKGKKTGDPVGEGLAKTTYTGFRALWYDDTTEVAADGSTVIDIYYERNWYLMQFDLDGGYGVEPIYAQYGADLEIKTPSKAGYVFNGWVDADGNAVATMPTTMSAENVSYKATWRVGGATFTVVYWLENADDEGYSVFGMYSGNETTGASVNGETYKNYDQYITTDSNFEAVEPFVTYEKADADVVVKGDNSTVVNVYFTRKEYTLKFYYAMEDTTNSRYYVIGGSSYAFGADGSNVDESYENITEYYMDGGSWSQHRGQVDEIPRLNENGKERNYTTGYDTDSKTVTSGNGWTTYSYKYHYISFTAKYGANISTLWPCDVFESVTRVNKNNANGWSGTEAFVSAWNGEHRVYYSQHNTNQTIKGNYEQLVTEIMWDYEKFKAYADSNDTIDYVCFWENGANIDWSVPELYRYQIWVPVIERQDTSNVKTKVYQGTTYYLRNVYDTVDNSKVEEQTHPTIQGLTYANITPTWDEIELTDEEKTLYKEAYEVDFYYTRNQYNLTFMNDGAEEESKKIYFEADISDESITPSYPDSLEPDAYEFAGWYTTSIYVEGTEFDFAGKTMPANDIILYAKWTPVTHPVTIYANKDDQNALVATFGVGHDEFAEVSESATVLEAGMFPSEDYMNSIGGGKTFVGWFYEETVINADGTTSIKETAFAPENMPVKKELNIYAKWSYNEPVTFTVYYRLADENGDPIQETDENGKPVYINVADPMYSRAMYGTTITVQAKTGDELYEQYRTGYFPHPPSHSVQLIISDDGTQNEYVFLYTKADAVPYRVMYIEVDENGKPVLGADGKAKQLADSKYVGDNSSTVVTENYVRIRGYMPDEYQKRLIVMFGGTTDDDGDYISEANEGENIIFFYYKVDKTNAFWTVTHYIEPVGGAATKADWQQYGLPLTQTGVINEYQTAAPLDIEGFTYTAELTEVDLYKADGSMETVVPAELEQKLPDGGMDYRLYYKRNKYPVKVQYLIDGTTTQLADPELVKGADGTTVSTFEYQSSMQVSTDKTFEGYKLVSANPQTLYSVAVDGTTLDTIQYNILTFYYAEQESTFNYVVVGTEGCGTVDLIATDDEPATSTSETVTMISGVPVGATAVSTNTDYFVFEGWYSDVACTEENLLSTNASYVPTKAEGQELWPETSTFYAKFVEQPVTITYKVVGPDGCGTVDVNDGDVTAAGIQVSETITNRVSGTALGAAAAPSSNVYKFVGWYTDKDCTIPVVAADGTVTDTSFVPAKEAANAEANPPVPAAYDAATFYAKFEYNLTSLTIVKQGVDTTKDRDVSFVFNVEGNEDDTDLDVAIKENGRVTIYGLTVGNTYTVTEELGNWRYSATDSSKGITLVADADDNVVTFVNTRTSDKWLDGDCYDENVFTAVSQ